MGSLSRLLGVLAAVLVQTSIATAAEPVRSPTKTTPPRNIIFVLVDDLRYDAMGFVTPGLQTPNIDHLAKNGVYFPNAVVTSALCSPSRATILTGRTARNHRIVDNNNSSEQGLTFFPQYLRSAGYQTAFFGKWHMGEQSDGPREGFDEWVSFRGQGNYFPTDQLSKQAIASGRRQMLNVNGTQVPQKGYITDELTDYAMEWLEHGRDKSKPFFVYLSHKAVHSDAKPPERYATQYAKLELKPPASMANTEENNRGKPMWVRNQRNSWHGSDFSYHSERPITEYLRDYYRTLSPVDESLGRILGYLKKNKLLESTLVVFYSDNGFMMGEHGLIDKRNAYEPSVRVPMVAYAPGLLPAGVTNPAVVRNLDLAPTFLDVARVDAPSQFEGKSILPVASGAVPIERWEQPDFIYEYFWEWNYPQTPTTFAIVRNRIKYIQYQGVWDLEEIYDLNKDPDEMHNLSDDPAYFDTKLDLRKRLFTSLANGEGRHVVPFTERLGPGVINRDRKGPGAADFPPQWLITPDSPNRLHGNYPDSREKLEAEQQGVPYVPKASQ